MKRNELILLAVTGILFFLWVGSCSSVRAATGNDEEQAALIAGLQASKAREVAAANNAAAAQSREVRNLRERLEADSAEWAQRAYLQAEQLREAGLRVESVTRVLAETRQEFAAQLDVSTNDDGEELWVALVEKGPFTVDVEVNPGPRSVLVGLYGQLGITLSEYPAADGSTIVTAASDFPEFPVRSAELIVEPRAPVIEYRISKKTAGILFLGGVVVGGVVAR